MRVFRYIIEGRQLPRSTTVQEYIYYATVQQFQEDKQNYLASSKGVRISEQQNVIYLYNDLLGELAPKP